MKSIKVIGISIINNKMYFSMMDEGKFHLFKKFIVCLERNNNNEKLIFQTASKLRKKIGFKYVLRAVFNVPYNLDSEKIYYMKKYISRAGYIIKETINLFDSFFAYNNELIKFNQKLKIIIYNGQKFEHYEIIHDRIEEVTSTISINYELCSFIDDRHFNTIMINVSNQKIISSQKNYYEIEDLLKGATLIAEQYYSLQKT